MKDGDFSAFAGVCFPVDEDNADEKGLVTAHIDNLSPETGYAVYVRNVSGLRKLYRDTGESYSAAGSVRSLKTTKKQIKDLKAALDAPAVKAKEAYDTAGGLYSWDLYYVQLKDGKVSVKDVTGLFKDKGKSEGQEGDQWLKLPLDKACKKVCTKPKLFYAVLGDTGKMNNDDYTLLSKKEQKHYIWCYDAWYLKSEIAAVSNKGVVTLKGKGTAYLRIWDANTGCNTWLILKIDAKPDSVAAKKISMKSGETIHLSKLLEYKEGRQKVAGYYSFADLSVDRESNGYFTIRRESVDCSWKDDAGWTAQGIWSDELKQGHDIAITCLRLGSPLSLKVTDISGCSCKVDIQTSGIDPVKNLKAVYLSDKKVLVNYNYPDNAADIRMCLKDSGNNVIFDRVIDNMCLVGVKGNDHTWEVELEDYTGLLAKKSKYNLTAVAVMGSETSKPANCSFTTTDIPVSYVRLDPDTKLEKYGRTAAGHPIVLSTNKYGTYDPASYLLGYTDGLLLKSGNTYTLNVGDHTNVGNLPAGLDEEGFDWDKDLHTAYDARSRGTDVVTWKSLNTKVADVKAEKNTFSAKLTTKQPGTAEIWISSKNTKSLVGRALVTVNTAGEAKMDIDIEDPRSLSWNRYDQKPAGIEDRDIIQVTSDNEIGLYVPAGERQWFSFTAPEYGLYFWRSYDTTLNTKSSGNTEKYNDAGEKVIMGKGETCWFCYEPETGGFCHIYITGTPAVTISLSGKNMLRNLTLYTFIAPEDNDYTISFVDDDGDSCEIKAAAGEGQNVQFLLDEAKKVTGDNIGDNAVLSKNAAYEVTVTQRTFETLPDSAFRLEAGKKKYCYYTAAADGVYRFFWENIDSVYSADQKNKVDNGDPHSYPFRVEMKKGDILYFALGSDTGTEEAGFTVTPVTVTAALTVNADATAFEFSSGREEKLYSFTAPEDGTYTKVVTGTDIDHCCNTSLDQSDLFTWDDPKEFEQGQQVYISVSASSATPDERKSGTIRIVKPEVVKVTAGTASKDVSLDNDLNAEFDLETREAGIYTLKFEFSGKKEGLFCVDDASSRYVCDDKGVVTVECIETSDDPENHSFVAKVLNKADGEGGKFTVKCTVAKDTVPEFTGSVTVSVKKGEGSWYKYVVLSDGVYDMTYASGTGDGVVSVEYADKYAYLHGNTVGSFDSEDEGIRSHRGYYESGNEIYFRVKAGTEADASGTLKVAKRESEVLTSEGSTFTLGKNDQKWYCFSTSEPGWFLYTFKNSDTSETARQIGVNDDADIDMADPGFSRKGTVITGMTYYSANDTHYFFVGSDHATNKEMITGTASISIVQGTVTPVAEDTDISASADGSWYLYSAASDGWYRFSFDKLTGEESISGVFYEGESDKKHVTITKDSSEYVDCYLTAGTQYFWRFTGSSDKEAVAGKMHAAAIDVKPLTPGTAANWSYSGIPQYFSFTASESGRYKYLLPGASLSGGKDGEKNAKAAFYEESKYVISNELARHDGDSFQDGYGTLWIDENETWYFILSGSEYEEGKPVTGTFTLSSVDAEAQTLTLDQSESWTVSSTDGTWYRFVAPETGYYNVALPGSDLTGGVEASYVSANQTAYLGSGNAIQGLNLQATLSGENIYSTSGNIRLSEGAVLYLNISSTRYGEGKPVKGTVAVYQPQLTLSSSGTDLTVYYGTGYGSGSQQQRAKLTAHENGTYKVYVKPDRIMSMNHYSCSANTEKLVYSSHMSEGEVTWLEYYDININYDAATKAHVRVEFTPDSE